MKFHDWNFSVIAQKKIKGVRDSSVSEIFDLKWQNVPHLASLWKIKDGEYFLQKTSLSPKGISFYVVHPGSRIRTFRKKDILIWVIVQHVVILGTSLMA